ncbi:hypothetical protein H8E52_07340 [bacterium]|nr:hypothetical protein [bacterium]
MRIILAGLLLIALVTSAGAERIRVACTDFSTGMLSSMEAADPWTPYADELSMHSDAVLRWGGEYLVLVERLGVDALRILNPKTLALVNEFSTGGGSNPQDVIVLGDKAYISCNNRNEILVVEWPSGNPLDTVDLSAWADGDGYGEPAGMLLANDLIFVAIQRLDRDFYWLPVGDSYLAVIDPANDTLVDVNPGQAGVQAIALPAANPNGELQRFDDQIWLSCVGGFGLTDGGLVRVNPMSFNAELFIAESEFGGDLGDVGFADSSHAWAIVTDASFNTHLYKFNPTAGGLPEMAIAGAGWIFNDLEIFGDALYVTDRSYAAEGLRVLDAETGDLLSSAVDMGLPPYDILAPNNSQVDVPEAPALLQLSSWPNPFNPQTTIRFDLENRSRVSLSIFDSAGRKLRTLLADEELDPGSRESVWDGRGEQGQRFPSGVYHAKLRIAGREFGLKLVLLK